MDLRGLIKGVIMGIVEKTQKKKTDAVLKKEIDNNQLNSTELQFLLKLIANSAFQGKDIQLIYDLTAKLQKQLSK